MPVGKVLRTEVSVDEIQMGYITRSDAQLYFDVNGHELPVSCLLVCWNNIQGTAAISSLLLTIAIFLFFFFMFVTPL